jgi:hypothetical protein
MTSTLMRTADAMFFTGYAIWFALLALRRLRAPGMKLLPLTDRLRGLGLGVLLLPVFAAEPALWGTPGKLFTLAAPGVALAFWTFAPRHVSSKVVPLAIVADGLYGFYRVRLDLHYFYFGQNTARLTFFPPFLLLEAWVFVAVGLWLTWRATDQNSAVARVVLWEKGQRLGERGRPRWGLMLPVVLGLFAEALGRPFLLNTSWWGGGLILAVAAAVVLFVIRAPRAAGQLARAGLILFGLFGVALGAFWSVHPLPGNVGYGAIYVGSRVSAVAAGLEGLTLAGFGLWLTSRVADSRTKVGSAAELPGSAQARLVALGMSPRTAEHLLATSPQAALELVAEALNVEVPCALSSPKTSSSSGTA